MWITYKHARFSSKRAWNDSGSLPFHARTVSQKYRMTWWMEREIGTLNTRLVSGWWSRKNREFDLSIRWIVREGPVCDMPYGRALLAGFIIFGHWIFVRSTPVEKGVSASDQEVKPGVDLRSLHFPSEYHATGVLSLPTSNINEPFEVWHSQTYDKSRIDYYHGKRNILRSHLCTRDQEIKLLSDIFL